MHPDLDTLQSWILISVYINETFSGETKPLILQQAIEAVDKIINSELEGEPGEVIVTLAECQDVEWNQVLEQAICDLQGEIATISRDGLLNLAKRMNELETKHNALSNDFDKLRDMLMQANIELVEPT